MLLDSARWRSGRRRSGQTIPTSRPRSTTWPRSTGPQGRYADAEPLFKRALAIREKALGPDHPDVARRSTTWLCSTKTRAAMPTPSRSTSARWRSERKALGPDHPDVATSLNNLAVLYHNQGRYADAEPLYKRSLAIQRKRLVPIIPMSRPRSTTWLGSTAPKAATPMPNRSTSARWRSARKRSVPIIPMSRFSLNNLAALYDDQGRYADAEPLYKRALAIREKALGPDHPDVATSLNNLAELYRTRVATPRPSRCSKRALAICEKALGPDHPDVAPSLNNLAVLYKTKAAMPTPSRFISARWRSRRKRSVPIIPMSR